MIQNIIKNLISWCSIAYYINSYFLANLGLELVLFFQFWEQEWGIYLTGSSSLLSVSVKIFSFCNYIKKYRFCNFL